MFPLGTVLVPGMLLPLHVFEPRYRRLVDDCQAGDGTFGVVLIERGSEVGGGDVRTDVGTLAGIVHAEEMDDGRWMLAAMGLHRVRVQQWLPDDPYPRAEVVDWPDPNAADGEEFADAHDGVVAQLRHAGALLRELDKPAPPIDLELADDPMIASYQAITVAPLGPMDRQRLLETPTSLARMALLRELLADQIDLLQARLATE